MFSFFKSKREKVIIKAIEEVDKGKIIAYSEYVFSMGSKKFILKRIHEKGNRYVLDVENKYGEFVTVVATYSKYNLVNIFESEHYLKYKHFETPHRYF